jgi:hypothetical protein
VETVSCPGAASEVEVQSGKGRTGLDEQLAQPVDPLRPDRDRRREDYRRASQPQHELEPEHGLARSGRSDDVDATIGEAMIDRLEHARLIIPPDAPELRPTHGVAIAPERARRSVFELSFATKALSCRMEG